MPELTPSIVLVWFVTDFLRHPSVLKVQGSIAELSETFRFNIEEETTKGFNNLIGRRCQILDVGKEYQFISLL